MSLTRTSRRWALGGLVLGVLVWIVAVALAATTARDQLEEAAVRLGDGRRSLQTLDVEHARPALDDAFELVRSAQRNVHRAHVSLAARIPYLGNSLRTGRIVADGAAQIVERVRAVADAVAALPGGTAALQPKDGRLPTQTFAALAGPLAEATEAVTAARAAVLASPSTWLATDAREGRAELLELTAEVLPTLEAAAAATAQLPTLLGASAPKRYLLVAANPAELRGVGGFAGAHAIVTFDDGRLSIGPFRPIWELENVAPGTVEAPSPAFAERYGPYGGTWSWLNQNMSADFPSSATMMERLWEASGNQPVDGTILVDPFAFETLLHLTGPVDLPETGRTLRPGNVVDYVTNESFGDIDDTAERKEVIGAVAASTLGEFLAGNVVIEARTIRFLGTMFARRHVVVHARDPQVQEAIALVGLDGALQDPDQGVFVNVTLNSGTASKVDYWLGSTVRTTVTPVDDGAARVTLDLELVNDAPSEGEPRTTIGPNTPDFEAGGNRLWVSVYCGSRCRFEEADPGTQGGTVVGRERGQAVAGTWVDIASASTVSLRYAWIVADAWWVDRDEPVVGFTYQDQATVRGRGVELVVEIPASWSLAPDLPAPAETASVADGRLVWARDGHGDVRWDVPFVRADR